MPVDRGHAGQRRDYYRDKVSLNLGGPATDAWDLRRATLGAFEAARWASGADGTDERVTETLQWGAQLSVALLESIRGNTAPVPFRGDLFTVPAGLPLDGFNAGQWAEALFAATAVQDAASAVRLSRVRVSAFAPGGPPGQAELATALATIWTGDGNIGPLIVAALERTDPKTLAETEVDAALDLVVPQAAVFGALTGETPLQVPLQDAAERFVRHWAGEEPEGLLSIPLSGLAVLGQLLAGATPAPHAVMPTAIVERSVGTILACPVCAEPFDPAQRECAWCSADLTADAPVELPLAGWLSAVRTPCPSCGSLVHPEALRCWSCGERRPRGS